MWWSFISEIKIHLTLPLFAILFFQNKRTVISNERSKMKRMYLFLFLMSILFIFLNCSRSPSPRVVVMDFIEAVNKADTASIQKYVDWNRFTQEKLQDLTETERQKIIPQYKDQLESNFLGNGETRLDWQTKMIVVNDEKITGDLALVEVTFVDQKTGLTEYTNAKLYKKNKNWLIYYIKD